MISSQPKFQVFVSSTFNDLEDERRQIIKATLEMGHIPVGMEMFSAADEEQWKVIQRQIDISDYYVVIIARRYGSRTPENISYTEKEYRYALETNIPIIGFVLDSNASWDDKRSDKVKKDIESLKKFKVLIQKKPVAFFTNPDDLSTKYSIALIKLINTNPRVGWVRVDQIPNSSTLDEFAKITKERDELREFVEKFDEKYKIEELKKLINTYEPITIINDEHNINVSYDALKFFMDSYDSLVMGEEISILINKYIDSSQANGDLINYNFIKDFSTFIHNALYGQIEKLFNLLAIINILEIYEVSREKSDNKSHFIRMSGHDKTYEVRKYKLTQLGRNLVSQNIT